MEISKFSIDISIQKPPKASNLNGNLNFLLEISIQKHPKASNLNGNLKFLIEISIQQHQISMEISKFSIEISIQKPPKESNLNGNLQIFNRHLHPKASKSIKSQWKSPNFQ